jgi:hypothetical protein
MAKKDIPDNQPDYANVLIPEGKHPEEYNWRERRADILRIMREREVTPWDLNQSQLAKKRYDVSQPTISKDINKRLMPYLRDRMGANADVETDILMRDIVDNIRDDAEALRAQGDRDKSAKAEKNAASVLNKWWDWMFESGEKDRAPRRTEVDANVDVHKRETKVYAGVDLADLPGVDEARLKGVNKPAETEDEDAEAAEIEVE